MAEFLHLLPVFMAVGHWLVAPTCVPDASTAGHPGRSRNLLLYATAARSRRALVAAGTLALNLAQNRECGIPTPREPHNSVSLRPYGVWARLPDGGHAMGSAGAHGSACVPVRIESPLLLAGIVPGVVVCKRTHRGRGSATHAFIPLSIVGEPSTAGCSRATMSRISAAS